MSRIILKGTVTCFLLSFRSKYWAFAVECQQQSDNISTVKYNAALIWMARFMVWNSLINKRLYLVIKRTN